MDPTHLAEIIAAVIAAVGGVKGIEWAKSRRDNRKDNPDGNVTRADLLELQIELGKHLGKVVEVVQEEGTKTRQALRDELVELRKKEE